MAAGGVPGAALGDARRFGGGARRLRADDPRLRALDGGRLAGAHPGGGALLVSPAELEDWLKVVASAGAAVAAWFWVWAPLSRWRARRRLRREEQERTIRYLADAVHALLRERVRLSMPDGDRWRPREDQLAQQAVRIYEQRNALFRADGLEPPPREPDPKDRPLTEAEVIVLIRRTQAIKDMQDRETPAAQQTGETE